MLHKYIFSVLILCFTFHFSMAQNTPGYLGKKAFIDYNFTSPFPLGLGPNYSNFFHNFRFNYVVRRRAQLGTSFELYTLEGDVENSLGRNNVSSRIHGKSIGINFDWYSKFSLAPLGRYFRAEYKYIFGNYEDAKIRYDQTTFTNIEYTEKDNFKSHYIGFGMGTRRIFFDKMVFNVGGSLGLALNAFSLNETGYKDVLGSTYFWQMYVGIGYLLF